MEFRNISPFGTAVLLFFLSLKLVWLQAHSLFFLSSKFSNQFSFFSIAKTFVVPRSRLSRSFETQKRYQTPMAKVVSEAEKHALAVTYAALILHDGNTDITADNLKTVVKAAGIEVPEYFPKLWAKGLAIRPVDDIISSAGSF